MPGTVAAVDLGATSGRVILGSVGRDEVTIRSVARFPNGPVTQTDGLHWNVSGLYDQVLTGLRSALADAPDLRSIGIDAWAVDYGRMRDGRMLAEPFHYRDARNEAGVAAVRERISDVELYARNGLQMLPFNTVYQLTADRLGGALQNTDAVLLIPDLLTYWLTGTMIAELTNASTTGLVPVSSSRWDVALLERLDLPAGLFPELVDAGTQVGGLRESVAASLGTHSSVSVTAVGSHDTASAVVAVPSTDSDFAYISCGTWGLVGVELDSPVLTEESRRANFTNERGVDGRVRFLHNVMGLWLLSECVRGWEESEPISLPALLDAAAAVSVPVPIFDANDPTFLAPGNMPQRIAEWLGSRGLPLPGGRAAFVRCIVESLAAAFASTVAAAAQLSGTPVSIIHLVGGGAKNRLLCQSTADRSGLPVVAGPVEATAIGNILVQARSTGLIEGDLESLRSIVARSVHLERFEPALHQNQQIGAVT